jgi:hypothetical protein
MRRHRQRLQVQTFPFLAVLLCTMGSLILLLLVIDRRAKAVARAKANQTVQQTAQKAAEAEAKRAADRQAEWERKRRELRLRLAQQERDVSTQIQAVKEQTIAAAGKLREDEARLVDLRQRLHNEETLLRQDRQSLQARHMDVEKADDMKEAAQKEATRLATELSQLEQVLIGLKALRQKEQQTYSVMPYLGRNGENRRPIYVECGAEGVVFHPDRLVLAGLGLTPLAVRQELDRRVAEQHRTGPETTPYLLLLVRPEGLDNYYVMHTALAGLKIDFGYELIDRDWVLDFSEKGQLVQGSPWHNAGPGREAVPAPPVIGTGRPSGSGKASQRVAGLGVPAPSGFGSSPGSGVQGGVVGLRGPGVGSQLVGGEYSIQSPRYSGFGPLLSPGGGADSGSSQTAGTGYSGQGAPDTAGGPVGPIRKSALPWLAAGSPQGNRGYGTSLFPIAGLGSGPGPGAVAEGPRIAGPEGPGPRLSGQTGTAGTGGSWTALQPSGPVGLAGSPGGSSSASGLGPPAGSNSGAGVAIASQGLAGAPQAASTPVGVPSLLPPVPGSNPGQPTGAQQASSAGRPPAGSPGVGGDHPGERAEQGASEPGSITAGAVLSSLRQTVRKSALPLGRLIADRDWIISIECQAEQVVLLSTGQQFPTGTLRRSTELQHPLTEAVRRLIDHRQATVRPGEPPYRPILRFRVQPDGLRSYYAANAVLDDLHLATTRENVQNAKPPLPDPFRSRDP